MFSEYRPFWLGLLDGLRSGQRFSSGRTWGDYRDEAYGNGVNLGRRLRGRKD